MEHFLTTIPPLAVYLVVALLVGSESLGVPLPGETMLVIAALLSSRHELDVSPHSVAIAGILGAAIGDSIGYAIGHRWGTKLFDWLGRKFPKHVHDDLIAYAEHVFRRYGIYAVFFGRFVALLRIFAGPLSGSLHMPYHKFLPANVAGALCWAGGTTYLVYYLGQTAEDYLKGFSYVGLAAAVIFGLLASTMLRRKLERQVEAYAAQRRAEGNPQT